ncbi:MAG: hypothetical protein AB2556_26185 [Candidatus Thiodiazotropha sp.]
MDCPNEHLRYTFLHPDEQARGCTRIEVSLYTCHVQTPKSVSEALALVSPCICRKK